MTIEKRRILCSVELLYQSRMVHVKWLDQVLDGAEVIKETPHRCAYPADGVPDLPDPEKPFAAEQIIRANVEQFGERLAAETEARQRLEADLAAAAQSMQAGTALLEQTGAMLKARDDELTNTKALLAARDQALKEARSELLQATITSAKLRDSVADLHSRLAGRGAGAPT